MDFNFITKQNSTKQKGVGARATRVGENGARFVLYDYSLKKLRAFSGQDYVQVGIDSTGTKIGIRLSNGREGHKISKNGYVTITSAQDLGNLPFPMSFRDNDITLIDNVLILDLDKRI